MGNKNFQYKINKTGVSTTIAYDSLFDLSYVETSASPIDTFHSNTQRLNILITWYDSAFASSFSPPSVVPQDTLPNLIFLGYISAVESYLREVIRKLILIDKPSLKFCENQQLTYGAAIIHKREMLPEALLENSSFASKKNIIDTFKNTLGLKGHIPIELEKVLADFENICQIRHCVIHRHGKLGTNNIIKLGLDEHSKCLEKPLSLTTANLLDLFIICQNTVVVTNQTLLNRILQRSVDSKWDLWKWDLRKDKKLLKKYFDLFQSIKLPPASINPTIQDLYEKLKTYKNT